MEVGKLTVEYRSTTGKNEARRLRAAGKVPGICYGLGGTPMLIALSARDLKKALDPEKRQNTVINVTVTGGDGAKELTVMLKDYQVDAIRRDVRHVDLVVIDVNKEVNVEVPLVLTGKAIGLVDGGQLHTNLRQLLVLCKPADIPAKIEVDISPLKMGDALHVSDVKLPKGVKAATPLTDTIASVVAPKAEKVTDEAAEAAAAEASAAATAAATPTAAGKAAAGAKPDGKADAKPAKEAKK